MEDHTVRMANNRRVISLMQGAPGVTLAQAWFGVAEVELESKRVAESLDARAKSIAILEQVLARDPNDAEAARWLATSQKRLAYTHITQTRDFAKAGAALAAAMQIDQRRLARDPGNAVIQLDLALGQAYMAGLLRRRGDLPGALVMHQSAIALRDGILRADPRNVRGRYLLACANSLSPSRKG